MPTDPALPSLLNSLNANKASISSTPLTGSSTPLNPISHNALPPSTSITNSSLARLTQPQPQRINSPNIAVQSSHHPLLNSSHHASSAPATPASTALLHQRHRESSAGANDMKRRRLNPHLGSIPPTSSSLARQTSAGPSTPKPSTPSATAAISGRAGSAGPRAGIKKTFTKKVAPHQQHRKIAAATLKKSARRNKKSLLREGVKASPSSDGEDDSVLSSASGSDSEIASPLVEGPGSPRDEEDGEDEADDGGDDRKYCTCRNVSHGNMVACDNEDCPYEWFHWSCVGLTKEPLGKWYCEECREKM
jgi:inhibitor of growth protein 3